MNIIVTKIVNATNSAASMSSSLMEVETGSLSNLSETEIICESAGPDMLLQNSNHSLNDIENEETYEYPKILVRNSI